MKEFGIELLKISAKALATTAGILAGFLIIGVVLPDNKEEE